MVDAGFGVDEVHAIRVFTDLVPGSLLDLEPGGSAALVELEQAVAARPEYLPLATQVHLLAHRSRFDLLPRSRAQVATDAVGAP